jgi:manganese oxidase
MQRQHRCGGWDHPVHIHFEEGQILERSGLASNVPAWEQGRKDVYRMRPGGTVTLFIQFRDWSGMFMEHCHNTMHEDNAMLLRWEVNSAGPKAMPTPIPAPTGVTFPEILAGAFAPYQSQTDGCEGAPCASSPYVADTQ